MGNSAKFWDRVAERYSKQPVADEKSYQKKLEITRSYFNPSTEVLELGCGTGSTAITHSPYVKHIRAVDISAKMLAIAQEKADKAGCGNVTFEHSTIDELTVADQSLDVVLGLSILHLLENKEDVISRVYQMLEPGGIFVTSTVCLGDRIKFMKYIIPLGKWLGLMPLVKVLPSGS